MKILLINHYAGSPTMGMEYRPYYMAREWVRLGHSVTIVAASNSHVRSHQPQNVGIARIQFIDGIRYVWVGTPRYAGSGIGRMLNIATFLAHLSLRTSSALRESDYDAVIASSTYPIDAIPARWIANRCRAKFVFELHDLWPLSPMELGGYSSRHPFIRLMQFGEDYYCRHADGVVSLLPCTNQHLTSRGLDLRKWAYVPNGIVLDAWNNQTELNSETRRALEAIRAQGKLVLGYTGALGPANAMETFVDVGKEVLDKANLVIFGHGPHKEALKQRAAAAGSSNIYFFESVPKPMIPSVLAMFDAAYLGTHRNKLYQFGVSPNKLFDYMMAGTPFIEALEAGNSFAKESGGGLSIAPADQAALANAIRQLASMPVAELSGMGARGRKFVIANHDYVTLAKRFLDALQRN
jgi:glycosyltransferase involved in cell wall biosynthesis